MHAETHAITLTTIADGSATGYVGPVTGRIHEITYAKVDFDNGVDFVVSAERTGVTIWSEENVNASKTVLPRVTTHTTAGVGAAYAAGGAPVLDAVVVAKDRVKIVIASGGNTKSGLFYVTVA